MSQAFSLIQFDINSIKERIPELKTVDIWVDSDHPLFVFLRSEHGIAVAIFKADLKADYMGAIRDSLLTIKSKLPS